MMHEPNSLQSPRLRRLTGRLPRLLLWLNVIVSVLIVALVVAALVLIEVPGSEPRQTLWQMFVAGLRRF